MKDTFNNQSVIIIGATGGLGSSFAKAFAGKGARLLLVGRNEQKLEMIAAEIAGDTTIATLDVTDERSVKSLADFAAGWSDKVDIVVNASGCDVRKSLDKHSYDEVRSSLDINLLGAVLITKAFLPHMRTQKGSTIVHIGGFADGRMAFPYYSVDAASRAGLFTFVESMNRELALEGNETRLTYFCPSPADTDAERPFHSLWKTMGISIVPADRVAEALLKTLEKRKTVSIMGGVITVLFAKLNSIYPKLADAIIMKRYGRMLREFLYGTGHDQPGHMASNEAERNDQPGRMASNETKWNDQPLKKGILTKIAIVLVILSFVFYGMIALVPFLPLTLSQKAVFVPVLIVCGEITWWVGVAIVGKQVVTRYRKYLNPCNWFSCKRKTQPDNG